MHNIALPTALPPVASLTKRDYARHQSISVRTLDHWREAGLPCLAISSRKILFPVAECDQWVRERFLMVKGADGSKSRSKSMGTDTLRGGAQ